MSQVVTIQTASYECRSTDYGAVLRVDASRGPVGITLPDGATDGADPILVQKVDLSSNPVTVTARGATVVTLSSQWDLQAVWFDAGVWGSPSANQLAERFPASSATVALASKVGGSGSGAYGDAFNPRSYGAKCDAVRVYGATVTSGSNVITAPSGVNIGPQDIGKPCALVGAGATLSAYSSSLAQNQYAPLTGFIGAGSSGTTINLVTTSGGSTPANASQTLSGTQTYPPLGGPNAPSPTGTLIYGTDDTAPWQAVFHAAAAQAATGGYTAIVVPGRSVVTSTIYAQTSGGTPANNVGLRGDGAGASGLHFIGTMGSSAVIESKGDGSTNVWNSNNRYIGFEVDCSGANDTAYNVDACGLRLNYNTRLYAYGVYVHDAPATGFGVDYSQSSIMGSCEAANNGRLNNGTSLGGAGFGHAIGWALVEDLELLNCNGRLNGRDGAFFELDSANAVSSSGSKVTGGFYCYNAGDGVGDCGVNGMVTTSPVLMYNKGSGFHVWGGTIAGAGHLGYQGQVIAAYSAHNSGHGFFYDTTSNGGAPTYSGEYKVAGGYYVANTGCGVRFDLGAATSKWYTVDGVESLGNYQHGIWFRYQTGTGAVSGIKILNNNCMSNGQGGTYKDGIAVDVTVTGLQIKNNTCSTNQGYGIDVGNSYAGTITNLTLSDNDLVGSGANTSGALNVNASVTKTNWIYGDNPGLTVNSGAPTLTAPKATLYRRTDGAAGSLLYVNQDGGTTWAAVA